MKITNIPILPVAALLAFLSPCNNASAQTSVTLQADLTRLEYQRLEATNLIYLSGGSGLAFGGAGELFCFEQNGSNPSGGSTHTYELVGASDLFDHTAAAERGEDLLHWVFDEYYESIVDDGTLGNFQLILWELAHDYDGSLASLNTATGSVLWANLNGLISAYDSIAPGYRSEMYELHFLRDLETVTNYQDMILVTPIPEPSSTLLVGLAGTVCLLRRRRSSGNTELR